MKYKTGLKPSISPPKLRFGEYLIPQLLPPIPPTFGHQNLYPQRGWGMLGNDRIGDCTVAGAMHAIMVWRAAVDNRVLFTNLDAQDDYYAITGGEDTGVSMTDQVKYWQKVGFRDSHANRHKILAYMSIDPTNLDHVDAACYLFEVVGLGIEIGQDEEDWFRAQQPWAYPTNRVEGYHYVPMIGKNSQYRQAITWGGLQDINESWFKAKVNEAVAVLADEDLIAGKTLEGFDLESLKADLGKV